MNYIVLDLEFNQPKNAKNLITKPIVFYFEIIQIGAVKLDENYRAVDSFETMISPKYYKTMHSKVAKLTKITDEDLKNGTDFPTAFKKFKDWCGEDFAFLTWGSDDIPVLRDNMMIFGFDTAWIPASYNIQLIFNDQITKQMRQYSLTDALTEVGESASDVHNALGDAKSTAILSSHLDMTKGLVDYNLFKDRHFFQLSSDCVDSYFPKKFYSSKRAGLSDKKLISFLCPVCSEKITAKSFVRQNPDKFISVASCKNKHEYFMRFKFTKISDSEFSAYRLVYEMDEEKRRIFNNTKNRLKKKRTRYYKKGTL